MMISDCHSTAFPLSSGCSARCLARTLAFAASRTSRSSPLLPTTAITDTAIALPALMHSSRRLTFSHSKLCRTAFNLSWLNPSNGSGFCGSCIDQPFLDARNHVVDLVVVHLADCGFNQDILR